MSLETRGTRMGGRTAATAARRIVMTAAVLAAAGCGPRSLEPIAAPATDPAPVAERLRSATTPSAPQQAAFAWELSESGSKLQGRGAGRYEAPERLRIDLFGPRGETYLAAALVGDDFHIPAEVRGRVELPSPALLWGALGVARPPAGAELQAASETDREIRVVYATPEEDRFDFRATVQQGVVRLTRVERTRRGSVVESLDLTWSDAGVLRQTRYRDWSAYRDLSLNLESIKDASPFPPSIWRP